MNIFIFIMVNKTKLKNDKQKYEYPVLLGMVLIFELLKLEFSPSPNFINFYKKVNLVIIKLEDKSLKYIFFFIYIYS